jgi:exosome complex component MTR3
VVVTVLEGDEDAWWGDGVSSGGGAGWGLLNVLAGCITVASAAIADAGIDCVDVVSGGVAATVKSKNGEEVTVMDPCPAEHQHIVAACAVGYLAGRDEITEIWMKGDVGVNPDSLIEGATHAAVGSLTVLKEVLLEAVVAKIKGQADQEDDSLEKRTPPQDVEMTG